MAQKKFLPIILLALSVIVLPSCKWFKKADSETGCPASDQSDKDIIRDATPALVSINGRPVLTAKQFEDFINKVSEGNEQVRMLMQFVPDYKEQIFTAKKRSIIIGEWAKKKGIRNNPEYLEKEKMIVDQIRESLDTEQFIKSLESAVTDAEINKFYEENKNQNPQILISAQGIKAAGITFANQAAANDFAEAVKKSQGKNLEKVAKDRKLSVTQFGIVNQDSPIDSKVKEKILAEKTLFINFSKVLKYNLNLIKC